mgnify:CR=1 FL=1
MTKMTDVVKTYAQTIITAYNAEATQVEALLAVIKGIKVCDSEIERVIKECGDAWKQAKIKESTLATYKSQTKKVLEFAKTEDNRKKLDVLAKQSGSLSQLYRAIKKDGTGGKTDPSAQPVAPSEAVGKSEDMKPTGATSYSEIINKMKEASAHEVATLLLTALGEDKAMQVADDILASLAKTKKAA